MTEAATETSFEAMSVRQKELADILSRDPAVDYINSTVGAGGPNPTANYGRLFIALKPRKERESAAVVMARLRQKATQVPGMQAFFQSIQNLNIGGRPSKSQYQYTLQSGDTEVALPAGAGDAQQDRARCPDCSTSPPISTSRIRR